MFLKLVGPLSMLLLTFANSQEFENCSLTVTLTTGEIEGHYAIANSSVIGRTFLGIPYAEAPLGSLRFALAKPKAKWNGTVFPCHYYKPACWQNRSRRTKPTRTSEDCLYLNVFIGKNCTAHEPCAVVVFIHGGEFDFDSPSMFDPEVIHENFARKSLMFVTVAYRLGIFGFFSTSSSEAPGNFGLSDIIEALRWVKREARAFGGDPSRVTLMGHSSGGSAVSLLTLSPKTEDLIEQAIVMSGSALSPQAFFNDITPYVLLAYRIGCHPLGNAFKHNISAVVECIRAIPADQLDYEYTKLENEFGFFTAPKLDGPDGILPASPIKLMQNRRSMPYLLGTTRDEFTGNMSSLAIEEEATPLTLLLACQKASVYWKIRLGRIRQKLKDCFRDYALKARVNNGTSEVFNWSAAVSHLENDNEIFWPVYADAATMRDAGGTVYLYSFDYVNSNSDSTPHSIDLTYVLGLHKFPFDAGDENIQQAFLTLLINFIRNGDPTPTPVSGVIWEPLASPDGCNYLSIDDKLEMKLCYHEDGQPLSSALLVASPIFYPPNGDKRKTPQSMAFSPNVPSERDLETFDVIYAQAESEGHTVSTNGTTETPQQKLSKPGFAESEGNEVALYWTCIALLVTFVLVGVLLLICCGKGKHNQRQMRCVYEPLGGNNDKQSVPTYQTFSETPLVSAKEIY